MRRVAVAVRNRWRRRRLPEAMRGDVSPKNILLDRADGRGQDRDRPPACGIDRGAFIKVRRRSHGVGYHGRDVESMIRDLLTRDLDGGGEMTESVKGGGEASRRTIA
jgi:ATP-dependent HslUV protease ATP-binding subunit HslU